MKKCNSCGRYFILRKENRYEIVRPRTVSEVFNGESPTVIECFDCPKCGCQNVVNVREIVGMREKGNE